MDFTYLCVYQSISVTYCVQDTTLQGKKKENVSIAPVLEDLRVSMEK